MKLTKLRLTLDVDLDPQGTSVDYFKECLRQVITDARPIWERRVSVK